MSTRLFGVLVDGLNKPIINATVTLLARQNTLTILNGSEAIFRTDAAGFYNITVQSGHYNVIIGPQGIEPYKAGEIALYADSEEGSLNGYLVNWVPEELTPEVIKEVQDLVARSEAFALDAGRSASAANLDATDARGSKAASQSAAADALVYKNDAKSEADAAKLAQQGASGSANTATQAVTTVQNLKSDVEQLKSDTQTIKDAAVRDVTALKDTAEGAATTATEKALEAAGSATTAGEKAVAATSAADRAETAAASAEQVTQASLKKDQNLADLTDKGSARGNLGVDSVRQSTGTTIGDYNAFTNPQATYELRIANNGEWRVVRNDDNSTSTLSIGAGGTGAPTAKGARQNLDSPVGNRAIGIPNNSDVLESLKISAESGYYSSGSIVTGVPEIAGWYMFDLHVHGKDDSGVMNYGNVYCTTSDGAIWYALMVTGVWSTWRQLTLSNGLVPVKSGGTGSPDASGARINLGLGPSNTPVFASLDLSGANETTSGILALHNRNAAGAGISYSRLYHEIQNGVAKTTIHTRREGGGDNYFQIDEAGRVSNVTELRIGLNASALGSNSITIGDSDSGLKWDSDGHISAFADSARIFAWTPSSINTYRVISSYADDNTRGMYVNGTRRGDPNALIAGQVEGGAFSEWRRRASGLLVEHTGFDAAVSIFKSVYWGQDWISGMDSVKWSAGGVEVHLYVGGADYSFGSNGVAAGVSWVSTSDIRLKAQLKEITSAKDKVKVLQGYTYFKRNNLVEDEHSFYSEEAGLIAQDVQTVLPEAVYKVADTDYLSINYAGVTALLTNAMKEMMEDAEAQNKRITTLEDEVAQLKLLVAKLVGDTPNHDLP